MLRYVVYGRIADKAPTFVVHIFQGCDAPQDARTLARALNRSVPTNTYWPEKLAS